MASEHIELDVSPDGVAVVLINRPSKRNALSFEMVEALQEAFDTLQGADHVRIVFLKGAEGTFCSGMDLDMVSAQATHDRQYNEADAQSLAHLIKTLHELPQLTVVAAEGFVAGAGVSFASAADWVIATADTQFRVTGARLGLNPAHMMPYLIESMGVRNARGFLMSTAPLDAQSALNFGLVSEIAEDDAGLQSAMARLTGLALETSPSTVRAIKETVRYVSHHKRDDSLTRELVKRDADARVSPAGREGVTAFLEKRAPIWPIE